jgi:hypothetical protein
MWAMLFSEEKNSVPYSRVCDSYHNFLDKGLLFECFTVATVTWENVPEYLYHKWPYIYICSVWRNHKPSFPHSWLIEFQTATKRRMPLVSIRNIPFNFFLNVGYAFFWRKNSVRYSRACDSYHNFLDKRLLFECFAVATVTWENVPEYLYHKWPYIYTCSVWRNHKPSFPHSWLIEFQTATKRRMPLVEQEPTLPVLIPF